MVTGVLYAQYRADQVVAASSPDESRQIGCKNESGERYDSRCAEAEKLRAIAAEYRSQARMLKADPDAGLVAAFAGVTPDIAATALISRASFAECQAAQLEKGIDSDTACGSIKSVSPQIKTMSPPLSPFQAVKTDPVAVKKCEQRALRNYQSKTKTAESYRVYLKTKQACQNGVAAQRRPAHGSTNRRWEPSSRLNILTNPNYEKDRHKREADRKRAERQRKHARIMRKGECINNAGRQLRACQGRYEPHSDGKRNCTKRYHQTIQRC